MMLRCSNPVPSYPQPPLRTQSPFQDTLTHLPRYFQPFLCTRIPFPATLTPFTVSIAPFPRHYNPLSNTPPPPFKSPSPHFPGIYSNAPFQPIACAVFHRVLQSPAPPLFTPTLPTISSNHPLVLTPWYFNFFSELL